MVEQLFCKQQVVGSIPTIGSKTIGSVAEWFKATVLKTVVPFGNQEFESLRFRKFTFERKLKY